MSRSSYSVNDKTKLGILGNPDPFLIIEKSLEENGQPWVENVNLIEDLLVQVVQRLSVEYPQLKATFVVRRLPNFMVPFVNKNEYAVILEKFDFSLVPNDPTQKPKIDSVGKPNFGQIEIFLPRKRNGSCQPVHTPSPPPPPSSSTGNNNDSAFETEVKPDFIKPEVQTMEDCNVFLNNKKAYYSHEVFKAFATAFTKVIQKLSEENPNDAPGSLPLVQIIGPHLLKNLKCNPEVSKIFRLITEPPIRLNTVLKQKCKTTVNHLKSYISMSYVGTEVIIRPSLFYEHGYHRVNANLTERIPLYHGGILTVGEALLKGCLLFPTSFETLWTLNFWPSESHMTSLFHPSSMIIRLYKMYGSFCLNPVQFYETLNNIFLLGSLDDLESLLPEDRSKLLSVDYLISSFLYELEEFSGIEDWAPRNFSTRLLHLLRSAMDCFDKGFHSDYFTKINVLRGLWRNSGDGMMDYFDREEKSALKELDSIADSPETMEDYKDNLPRFLETDDLEDEFGLKFDDLDVHDDDHRRVKSPPKLTSDLVYSSVNPFETFGKSLGDAPSTVSASKGTTKSLSNFLKKLGSRSGSEAGTVRNKSTDTVRSMSEVASEFEKSIALQRARPSLFPFPIPENQDGISSRQNLFSLEEIKPGTSSSHQQYENDAFEKGSTPENELGSQVDSIYYVILQNLKELPPSSDMASDTDILQYIEKTKKAMESQEELVMSWGKLISEVPKPKFICPHAFSTRQIQYLARVIHVVSRCSPSTIKIIRSTKLPSWEISGDILRIVLHQMRSESQVSNNVAVAELRPPKKSSSFLVPRRIIPSRPIFKSFKRDPSTLNDPCKLYDHHNLYGGGGTAGADHPRELDPEEEMQLAMEDPETAATNRLLQWLWQLRTSEIGRLSIRANKYLEELYQTSMVNSHFLEQHSEEKCFETLALRSAVAVTKIMETNKFPAQVPLSAAARKGWLWAEMILSLASWNQDKGLDMKAYVPVTTDEKGTVTTTFEPKSIDADMMDIFGGGMSGTLTLTKKKNPLEVEPDLDAVTLAFHSELATPIGWNDIEDPRQPGPYTVAILIFSSLGYYKLWEVVPGNLVHALVRLQKFNTLQHVGNMLTHPHRKTALNEVRKLNKSTSFRIHHFENNIMSKTFKRLASIRTSRKKSKGQDIPNVPHSLTCEEVGCPTERKQSSSTTAVWSNGREIECTKL